MADATWPASSASLFDTGPGFFTWLGDGFGGFEADGWCGRRFFLRFGLYHRAHAALGFAGHGGVGADPGDLEKLASSIVGNVIPANLILPALQLGAIEHLQGFDAAVVLDTPGPAFNVLVVALPFLPEGRGAAPCRALLEALLVLAYLHAIAANLQRALGEHDVSLKNCDLLRVIDGNAVGFQVDRLVAV